MRAINHYDGSFSVQVLTRDVEDFAEHWPGYGEVKPLTFQFSKRTGEVLDMCKNARGKDERGDFLARAIKAISENALAYGIERLGLAI